MTNKILCRIGGIISIISVFLPVFVFTYSIGLEGDDITVYYWMFGQIISILQDEGADEPVTFRFRELDILGTLCMMLIIIGAMLVIINADSDSKVGIIGGILIIAAMGYYVIVISLLLDGNRNLYVLLRYRFSYFTTDFIRFLTQGNEVKLQYTLSYGYFAALIGGIISIGGSIIPKRKKISNNGE